MRFANANIILLCISVNQDSTAVKVLSELAGIQSYYKEKSGSGNPSLDRYCIKEFPDATFDKESQELITGGNPQFRIPITIIVNNKSELIDSKLLKLLTE